MTTSINNAARPAAAAVQSISRFVFRASNRKPGKTAERGYSTVRDRRKWIIKFSVSARNEFPMVGAASEEYICECCMTHLAQCPVGAKRLTSSESLLQCSVGALYFAQVSVGTQWGRESFAMHVTAEAT